MPSQYHLWVRFFGHFQVSCGDEAVVATGGNSKVLSILKYLLVKRPHPVSRDHLMNWLWPESNPRRARSSLTTAIHALRQALGSCEGLRGTNIIQVVDGGYYRVNPGIWIRADVDDFDAHRERGRRLNMEGLRQEAMAEYEKAIELYRDDFLVEDVYEDWTMLERERLTNAYLITLNRLANYYMEAGQYEECIEVSYLALTKDRANEDSHRLLIHCYRHLGLLGRAQHQYRIYKRIMKHDLGIAPSAAMRRLADFSQG